MEGLFALWSKKSIFDEKLTIGWLSTLQGAQPSRRESARRDGESSDHHQIDAALTVRREALEAEEIDVLERKCRMNGLPRTNLSDGRDKTKSELIEVILACEEAKFCSYLKKVRKRQEEEK